MPDAPKAEASEKTHHSLKETIISLIIAFVFAFVFRGFVVEAFVIPTGSMAPTLLGQHVPFKSPESGAGWTVDPWDKDQSQTPLPIQGTRRTLSVSDPMTGAVVGKQLPERLGRDRRVMSGDRIFVLKYLYSLFDPSRFDVVVFKYPGKPSTPADVGEQENYIKRLVGLPNEEIALADGDVFYRPAAGGPGTRSDWAGEGWRIARKTERVQRALWQPVYDSRYVPLNPERNLSRWFNDPWLGRSPAGEADAAWSIRDEQAYAYGQASPTALVWDHEQWPIDDRYPYNEAPLFGGAPLTPTRGPIDERNEVGRPVFPVSDIRTAFGVEPRQEGLSLAAVLEARGHEFRADLEGSRVLVRMRPTTGGAPGEWRTLADEAIRGVLTPGEVTNVEFWHVDQTVQVWIDSERVAMAEYMWTPALRVQHATGRAPDEILTLSPAGNPLAERKIYITPRVRWEFEGSPFTLYRVRLDRDLYYQPTKYNPRYVREGQPGLGTHPSQPLVLGPDQFFLCGDNSPNSLDGRLWDTPDPWVAAEIDPTIGIVNRDLVIGKAFFVYFPSIHKDKRVPVPDVGRMRFIW